MTRVAWLDVRAGIAGDMVLGALIDHGVPVSVLDAVAEKLAPGRLQLVSQSVERGALAATHVRVLVDGAALPLADEAHVDPHHDSSHGPSAHTHRHLSDVLALLERLGPLDKGPVAMAARAYRALAEAEATVHGKDPSTVHFHEVGALDAVMDIAGVCVGLEYLGVEALYCSSLPWGQGTIRAAHGVLPNPAPATVRLLEGFATHPSSATFEQVTPTGMALLHGLGATLGPPEGFIPTASGVGAGTHPGHDLPNVVRLVTGDLPEAPEHGSPAQASGSERETVVELATNLDDTTPQIIAYTIEVLLDAGALDAWCVSAQGKKGRRGFVLSVLAAPERADALERVLFRETPTLGVRRRTWERTILPRAHVTVTTPYGDVRMKVRQTPEGEAATPEFDDCRACARAQDVPLVAVMDAARAAFARET